MEEGRGLSANANLYGFIIRDPRDKEARKHDKDKQKTASTPSSDIFNKRRRFDGNGLVDI